MNRVNESTLLMDDLAAHWTESALEIFKAAGIREISVDLELETWRSMKQVLRSAVKPPRQTEVAHQLRSCAV